MNASQLPPFPRHSGPADNPPPAMDPPPELRPVVALLIINLALSIVLTIVTIAARNTLVDYQFDHHHITDPALRQTLSRTYLYTIIARVAGNIIISVVYGFLVRALLRGRRWAYRRVILLGIVGLVALLALQTTSNPPWMHAEALVQAIVLGLLLYFVLRPKVRAHFAGGLRGREPTSLSQLPGRK